MWECVHGGTDNKVLWVIITVEKHNKVCKSYHFVKLKRGQFEPLSYKCVKAISALFYQNNLSSGSYGFYVNRWYIFIVIINAN